MKIKYLGTAAAEGIPAIFCECEACKKSRELGGRNIRTRSQAILDDKILIDFPADTYMHFLRYNIPLSKIKTCIITHSHEDHLYPSEIAMRKDGFAHVNLGEPLTFYATERGYDLIRERIEIDDIPTSDVKEVKIKPFEQFKAEGYKIMPIKASHDERTNPVVFAIEKDGKSIFYCNDTSELCDESMECLRGFTKEKVFDVISFDCTEANREVVPYVGHLSLNKCIALRREFISDGIADENTTFILNHFSHNGKDVVYDDFSKIAEKENFLTSYDGMEFEF